ncbi:hypothetical protein AAG570_002010 [Ranatra chinensis]|uniref:Uncharacterized protein n=1 Tax=Ranatra chinensis TaxID=642074 RepID=A0ABD0YA54_9HEMI
MKKDVDKAEKTLRDKGNVRDDSDTAEGALSAALRKLATPKLIHKYSLKINKSVSAMPVEPSPRYRGSASCPQPHKVPCPPPHCPETPKAPAHHHPVLLHHFPNLLRHPVLLHLVLNLLRHPPTTTLSSSTISRTFLGTLSSSTLS